VSNTIINYDKRTAIMYSQEMRWKLQWPISRYYTAILLKDWISPRKFLVEKAESSNECVHNSNNPCCILLWLAYCWILPSSIGEHNPLQSFVDSTSWHILIIWTNKMLYFLLIYFNNKPLPVSSRLAVHHQEDQLCINSNWYSQHKAWLYQLLFIQSWSSW
jgi:hypothetical protein